MKRLVKVTKEEDIFEKYKGTPIEALLKYHNLDYPHDTFAKAEILIGMCMDNRKSLRIPDNFAFILRSGGGNLRYSEFKVSYAIAIGGVKTIALIAHNNCGMVNLMSKKKNFINGLVDVAGWDRQWAEEHFMNFSPMFEIGNEIDFVLSEAKRLRLRYPNILVAPLYYNIDDNKLYLVNED
ncbi:carbonic anhydrase [Clostridium homopropionicum DSM 5847]|uniref:Carbonic anhydrase n=1 Tax=Clostridium homopropionicum DSM 5847 TaxID=1121318 RepID=A0A0L6ZAG4_9CLOT|nr:carbonic anhydrase [Clostridium homopropionicum]KOA19965.1 carbonic anhydrase [Clostridium homopropionicum DSM 5847]SFG63465.1 carbonic anhydrase [Clostridium homopropionicum]